MAGIDRRVFLKRSALSTGFGLSAILWSRRVLGANDRIGIGFLGLGSRGTALIRAVLKTQDGAVAHICDSQKTSIQAALGELKRSSREAGRVPRAGTDWREVIENRDLDAVMIATPDYLHAPLSLAAIEAGKFVFCEKPIGYTIQECFDLVKAVNDSKIVFQTGHQRRYSAMYRNARQMVSDGLIGKLTMVRGQWHRSHGLKRAVIDPGDERRINWHLYRETSTGLMGLLGSHQLDIVNWFVGAPPISVIGAGGIDAYRDGRETEDNLSVTYTYPSGVRFAYTITLTNGLDDAYELFLGTEAALDTSYLFGGHLYMPSTREGCHRCDAESREDFSKVIPGSPKDRFCATGTGEVHYFSLRGEKVDWWPHDRWNETLDAVKAFLRCCQTGERPEADVTGGCNAAVAALMANIAIREERKVCWSEFAGA